MRLVATSDTHFEVDITRIPDGDVFVHAGDLMDRGYPDEWDSCLAWLADLPHPHKYLVPGNHDFHLWLYPGPAIQDLRSVGVMVLGHPLGDHDLDILPNGMTIGGSPWVINLQRWAFNASEEEIAAYMDKLGPVDIMVTHNPIYGILDLVRYAKRGCERNTGVKTYRDYLNTNKPQYWIHGHIHEQYGFEQVDETMVYNASMCDIRYEHRNPPFVIDIE